MAISTIGNITYINQNMQTTSAQHANATQRGDFIPNEFEEKLKEIEEVRPTEMTKEVDRDSKNSNKQKQENKENEHKKNEQKEEESTTKETNNSHLLDIKA